MNRLEKIRATAAEWEEGHYIHYSDARFLLERIEHLERENKRLQRQIGKLIAGEDVEPMDVSVSWLEAGSDSDRVD